MRTIGAQIHALISASPSGLRAEEIVRTLRVPDDEVLLALESGVHSNAWTHLGDVWIAHGLGENLPEELQSTLESMHAFAPKKVGFAFDAVRGRMPSRPSPELLQVVIDQGLKNGTLVRTENQIALATFEPARAPRKEAFLNSIIQALQDGGLTPPSPYRLSLHLNAPMKAIANALNDGCDRNLIKKLGEEVFYPTAELDKIIASLRSAFRDRAFTPAELREKFVLSRKYADAILDYLEEFKFVRRNGPQRKFNS